MKSSRLRPGAATLFAAGLLGGVAIVSDSRPTYAQMSAPLREKLQQQNPVDARQRTVVPIPAQAGAGEAALAVPTDLQQLDKVRRVQRLIDDLERRRGAAVGTVKALPAEGGGVRLEHNLSKVRQNLTASGASPFGGASVAAVTSDATPSASALIAPADVEYRVEQFHAGAEQVVGIRSQGEVVAAAFKSGEAPVSVEVKTAGLTARQIEGSSQELPVEIKVGGESRQLRAGEVGKFGNIEVVIQASSNKSAQRGQIEGAPYALRLQLRSVN